MDNYNAAQDIPDSRDYTWEEFLGESGKWQPVETRLALSPILNQGKSSACTCFGSVKAMDESNAQEASALGLELQGIYGDAEKCWQIAKERGASESRGWVLQFALKLLRETYGVATVLVAKPGELTSDKISEVLGAKYAMVTGSNGVNWKATRDNPDMIAQFQKGAPTGHIYAGCSLETVKNSLAFGHPNSWGEKWGNKKGWFYTLESDFRNLYSTYAIIPKKDKYIIEALKAGKLEKYYQQAVNMSFTNAERPEADITASEIATLYRRIAGLGGIVNPTRATVINAIQDHIVRIPEAVKFHDRTRFKDRATDSEIYAMLLRAWRNDENGDKKPMSRKLATALLIRDFW